MKHARKVTIFYLFKVFYNYKRLFCLIVHWLNIWEAAFLRQRYHVLIKNYCTHIFYIIYVRVHGGFSNCGFIHLRTVRKFRFYSFRVSKIYMHHFFLKETTIVCDSVANSVNVIPSWMSSRQNKKLFLQLRIEFSVIFLSEFHKKSRKKCALV